MRQQLPPPNPHQEVSSVVGARRGGASRPPLHLPQQRLQQLMLLLTQLLLLLQLQLQQPQAAQPQHKPTPRVAAQPAALRHRYTVKTRVLCHRLAKRNGPSCEAERAKLD